jgi:hypothetical protein
MMKVCVGEGLALRMWVPNPPLQIMVDWVDWTCRGEGLENCHHFPSKVSVSNPSPLPVMPELCMEWGQYQ